MLFVAINPRQTNTTGAGVILATIEPADFEIVYYEPAIYTEKMFKLTTKGSLVDMLLIQTANLIFTQNF